MTSTTAIVSPPHVAAIRVSVADDGGWLVTVERDGHPLVREHLADWHRVERRVGTLRWDMAAILRDASAIPLVSRGEDREPPGIGSDGG